MDFASRTLLAIIGLKDNATKLDIITAKLKVTAVSAYNTPANPSIKIKGMNTATRTKVVAIIAKDTCLDPLYAATKELSPFSTLLYIFSNITIASSTTIPIASTNAIRVKRFIEKSKK